MQLVEQVDAHPDPVTETGARLDVGDPAWHPGSPCIGLMRTYRRVVGVIQMLYAAFFGWLAAGSYETGRFYHAEFHFKDCYEPEHLDFEWLIFTTACALMSFSGLIGGYGALRLRPWVRRWEVAYLGVLSAGMATGEVAGLSDPLWNPIYLTSNILIFLALTLPYVPFLFGGAGDAAGVSRSR